MKIKNKFFCSTFIKTGTELKTENMTIVWYPVKFNYVQQSNISNKKMHHTDNIERLFQIRYLFFLPSKTILHYIYLLYWKLQETFLMFWSNLETNSLLTKWESLKIKNTLIFFNDCKKMHSYILCKIEITNTQLFMEWTTFEKFIKPQLLNGFK